MATIVVTTATSPEPQTVNADDWIETGSFVIFFRTYDGTKVFAVQTKDVIEIERTSD